VVLVDFTGLNPLKNLCKFSKTWVELLRSKFKKSTQKLSSMLPDFDLDLNVDIEDQALGRQKMNWVFRLTLFNAF